MMTLDDLQDRRIRLWHATPDDALEKPEDIVVFLRALQWCYLIPRKARLYPSLLQAVTGIADCRVTASRLASMRMLLGDLWEFRPMRRSIVEIHALGRAPMLATRNFCRNLAVFLLDGKSSVRRLVREKFLNSLEGEILSLVRVESLSKHDFRHALNIHSRTGNIELDQALRSLERRFLLLRSGLNDEGRPIFSSTVTHLGIRSFRWSERKRINATEALILAYLDAVVADSRVGIKSFFRGIIPPALIDSVLYDLLLHSVLRVESNLILNGKKALFHG